MLIEALPFDDKYFNLLADKSNTILRLFLENKDKLHANKIIEEAWEMYPLELFSQEKECQYNLKYFPLLYNFVQELKDKINFLAISVVKPSDLELPHNEEYDKSYKRYQLPLQLPTTKKSFIWNDGGKTYHTMGQWSEMTNTDKMHYPLNPAINEEDRIVLIVDICDDKASSAKANKVLGKMREDLNKYVSNKFLKE